MTKTLLAVLTIAFGVAASAGGASADIYSGLPDWKAQLFTDSTSNR